MAKPPPGTTAQDQAQFYDIANSKKHLLLCAGPDCCDPAIGEAAWNYLKKRCGELKLQTPATTVFRTKCHCLRICVSGPILVVQPDGVWYHSATPETIERILQQHVVGGQVVKEFLLATQPHQASQ